MSHPKRHHNKSANNLIALGSAAVVAVYAAGYVRTADAAQRFNDESNVRRRPAGDGGAAPAAHGLSDVALNSGTPASAAAVAVTPSVAASALTSSIPSVDSSAATVKVKPLAVSSSSAVSSSGVTTAPITAPPVPAKTLVTGAPVVAPLAATTSAVATVTPPAPPLPATMTTALTSTATSAMSATTSQSAPPTTTTPTSPLPVDAAAKVSAKPALPPLPPGVKWRDGSYTGWGTSRHGDIQATVEVDGGKISYVAVAQCLTQYPCTWIEKLPQQVLDRQSPEVDSVSGATQSANAFYYAVVQALSKAK